jgi:uncharacterized heparinase superfamily protein
MEEGGHSCNVGRQNWRANCDSSGEITLHVKTLLRYWHTLRYLKPVQFYGRVWFKLARPRPRLAAAPPLHPHSTGWVLPARREPSLISSDEFIFLGEPGTLRDIGWDGPLREKLWRYNQHYFDDLNAINALARCTWHQDLLIDWVRNNPPGQGNGWEPYPTSLRIVNWIKWALAGNELPATCIESLAVQARWLTQRLEIHLLGNHLFANAKALLFAGLFFEGPEAEGWSRIGLRILTREVSEQVLPDGGHFERSTMYHALALEDMLDLQNLLRCYEQNLPGHALIHRDSWRLKTSQMLTWLNTMCHPDGEISFFNDAALGIAPSCEELGAYADRLGISPQCQRTDSRILPDTGYARLETKNAAALLDMAPVGPDYLPGHAHADTLSFELSVFGQRVLVNSGTSCYGSSQERLRQRGTAAHNTVIVAGMNSSEVWGGFRVAQRARALSPTVNVDTQPFSAECGHDGYLRLPEKAIHYRKWEMDENYFVIEDRVDGTSAHSQARFHFHPAIQLEADAGGMQGRAQLPEGDFIYWQVDTGHAQVESTSWHPRFGVSMPNQCLTVDLVQGKCKVKWSWS